MQQLELCFLHPLTCAGTRRMSLLTDVTLPREQCEAEQCFRSSMKPPVPTSRRGPASVRHEFVARGRTLPSDVWRSAMRRIVILAAIGAAREKDILDGFRHAGPCAPTD